MKISTILDQIDLGAIALPQFQRGYVWNREQVRRLMLSLYRRHPVGTLLVWVTKTESASARGDGALQPGYVSLLLDGQQRMTSLYGIIRGKPPEFFEGNAQNFTGLYFNLADESFEFYTSLKMKDNPLWISVTELMRKGTGPFIMRLAAAKETPDLPEAISRLTALYGIREIDMHVEQVTGEDKTVDVVVEIFNTVNSGGTKLSKADLALARVCAMYPQARDDMKVGLGKWQRAGFSFRLDWMLRCNNAVVTGEALFSALSGIDTETFRCGLGETEAAVDRCLDMISGRLGLDHDDVLGSRYSFPLMARYLKERGGRPLDHAERDKLMFWYIHTFLWGRYAGSTETILNKDLQAIESIEGGLDRLIELLQQSRGDLRVRPADFAAWSRGARFYPLLYMLTRVYHAKDWGSGLELNNHILGHLGSLQLHHVFPKAVLYKHGYTRAEVNSLANFTFLTQETNLEIGDRDTSEYVPRYQAKHPGAIESHWMPIDPALWCAENYRDFLVARRELLAEAANAFLDELLAGGIPEMVAAVPAVGSVRTLPVYEVAENEELEIIRACQEWLRGQGLPEGENLYELVDSHTGDVLAILDLAWPSGLQEGLSQPLALLIDEPDETVEAARKAGYTYFTNLQEFRHYVESEILGLSQESIPVGVTA